MFIGSRTWPPLHLDAVVAMRSESRAAPRAIATVIFSFCFFVMPVFVCRTAVLYCTRAKVNHVLSSKEGKGGGDIDKVLGPPLRGGKRRSLGAKVNQRPIYST
jgi:hypothetical protein